MATVHMFELGEDEVEDNKHGKDDDAKSCGLLVPAQVSVNGLWCKGLDEAYEFRLRTWLGGD